IDRAADAAEIAKGAEKKRLETERDGLREQMEAAALTVKVRALTSSQLLELRGIEDDLDNQAQQIVMTCAEPSFTVEQARAILEKLPATEGSKILSKGNELTFAEVKTPDFSPARARAPRSGSPPRRTQVRPLAWHRTVGVPGVG
ncbi:hypothetical protein ACTVFF_22525, partial [Escherichia coli]|uniref:hypothetical protein n=1 Tax=Escherichia coli TaxID=562 RepID=UPI003FA58C1B